MKIGILTYHFAYNFGANLQVLSTVCYLKNRGHSPIVINWRPVGVEGWYQKNTPAKQADAHEEYIATRLPTSFLCRTAEDIAALIDKEEIDGVIIGSDAVVNVMPFLARIGFSGRKMRFVIAKPECVNILPNPFWGSFMELLKHKIPCAMMSVSSQNSRYRLMSHKERHQAVDCLKRFNYISVRDTWTKQMMSWISRGNIEPNVTPDPVFAFNSNVPSVLSDGAVIKKFNLPKKYILVSFKKEHGPPDSWIIKFSELAEMMGFSCVAFPYPQELNSYSLKYKVDLPISPLEWYALIKHAAGYVGHNMHPIVSCIHNSVPFFSFDNYGFLFMKMLSNAKSSKIRDLLEATGLLENTSNVIGRGASFLAPDKVFKKLVNFNKTKCTAISVMMQERHEVMMKEILTALTSC
jgi:hypothetical protein